MKLIGYDNGMRPAGDTAMQSAIYEVAGRRVSIPADTDDNDIELAVIQALTSDITPMTLPEVRALLAQDDDNTVVALVLDEMLPFLAGRGFNPSPALQGVLDRRAGIKNKYPDGQPVPPPRQKAKG